MPFEVQIRTHEMHRAAEYGIAAHWMYKEGRGSQDDLDSKLAWLREALEMENYSDTTREFVENIRKDFFSDYVYVLTPQAGSSTWSPAAPPWISPTASTPTWVTRPSTPR